VFKDEKTKFSRILIQVKSLVRNIGILVTREKTRDLPLCFQTKLFFMILALFLLLFFKLTL